METRFSPPSLGSLKRTAPRAPNQAPAPARALRGRPAVFGAVHSAPPLRYHAAEQHPKAPRAFHQNESLCGSHERMSMLLELMPDFGSPRTISRLQGPFFSQATRPVSPSKEPHQLYLDTALAHGVWNSVAACAKICNQHRVYESYGSSFRNPQKSPMSPRHGERTPRSIDFWCQEVEVCTEVMTFEGSVLPT